MGTVAGLQVLPYVGARDLNTVGLLCSAMLFLAFLVVHTFRRVAMDALHVALPLYFVLYSSSNIATYVLPVVSFPRAVRSTFHGLSSSAAKLGAMSGALLFPVMEEKMGVGAVMAAQTVVCLAGAVMCHLFLE